MINNGKGKVRCDLLAKILALFTSGDLLFVVKKKLLLITNNYIFNHGPNFAHSALTAGPLQRNISYL